MATFQAQIAKALGVTPAGLAYLGRLAATGKSPQRGNEAGPLLKAGLVDYRDGARYTNYQSQPIIITDAGREIVRRARDMGW